MSEAGGGGGAMAPGRGGARGGACPLAVEIPPTPSALLEIGESEAPLVWGTPPPTQPPPPGPPL